MNNLFYFVVLFSTFAGVVSESKARSPFEYFHAEPLKGHLHLGLENNYLSEGRDNLDGDSLLTSSIDLAWDHFSARVGYGESPEQDYNELQFTVGLKEKVNNTEFYIAYTHLQFPFDDAHDNELGIGSNWSGLPLELAFAIDGYYSFDAQGAFWELSLQREINTSDKLTVTGMTTFGINQGYVADGHEGANHLALSIESEYEMTKSLSLITTVGYSWALNTKSELSGDDALIDVFNGGVHLQWLF